MSLPLKDESTHKANASTGTEEHHSEWQGTPAAETSRPHVVDRAGWPAGPWDGEPDRMQWAHAGLACLALRNSGGYWCGYVGVPAGHVALGVEKEDFDVHGGITYGPSLCEGIICHVPEPGMPHDVMWLGFDCAHCDDYYPAINRGFSAELHIGGKYRDVAYIRKETERLAAQVAAMASGEPSNVEAPHPTPEGTK